MRRLFPVLSLLIFAPLSARGSVVMAMGLPELVQRADLIVQGEAVRSESGWEDGKIITRTVVRVKETLKGAAVKELTFRHVGGVVNGIGQILHGEATLAAGEEAVLFLRALGGGEYRAVGMAQGKFRVETDASGTHAVQSFEGLALARAQRGAPARIVDAQPAKHPLSTFLARIRSLVTRPQAEGR